MGQGNGGAGDSVAVAEGERWSVASVMAESDRFMHGLGLPVMRRPEDAGQEYSFPANAARLTGVELGTLQLRLTGWYTWLLTAMGREEAELGALESVYEIALQKAMQRAQEDSGSKKRIVNDVLKALAIGHDEKLERTAKAVITKRARVKRLEIQGMIYHEQLLRLSREQSRRESEARIA